MSLGGWLISDVCMTVLYWLQVSTIMLLRFTSNRQKLPGRARSQRQKLQPHHKQLRTHQMISPMPNEIVI